MIQFTSGIRISFCISKNGFDSDREFLWKSAIILKSTAQLENEVHMKTMRWSVVIRQAQTAPCPRSSIPCVAIFQRKQIAREILFLNFQFRKHRLQRNYNHEAKNIPKMRQTNKINSSRDSKDKKSPIKYLKQQLKSKMDFRWLKSENRLINLNKIPIVSFRLAIARRKIF